MSSMLPDAAFALTQLHGSGLLVEYSPRGQRAYWAVVWVKRLGSSALGVCLPPTLYQVDPVLSAKNTFPGVNRPGPSVLSCGE